VATPVTVDALDAVTYQAEAAFPSRLKTFGVLKDSEAQEPTIGKFQRLFQASEDPELGQLRLQELDQPDAPSDVAEDPELGELRLQEQVPIDAELGRLRLWESPLGDPELGRLRLQEEPLNLDIEPDSDEEVVFLISQLNAFKSDNILLDDFDPVDDQIYSGSLALFAAPSLGPRTYFFGSLEGNIALYDDLSELNYSELELVAGIRQVLFPNTYADMSWTNQQFFSLDDGDRFLNDHSLRLVLSHRTSLTSQLFFSGYYQLRLSFTDPSDRQRIFNTLGVSLAYLLEPDLDVGLNYQFVMTDFTRQDRSDRYHEITAELNYAVSRNSTLSLFAGLSFGESTNSFIDFDSALLGLTFSTSISLF